MVAKETREVLKGEGPKSAGDAMRKIIEKEEKETTEALREAEEAKVRAHELPKGSGVY